MIPVEPAALAASGDHFAESDARISPDEGVGVGKALGDSTCSTTAVRMLLWLKHRRVFKHSN